MERESAFIEGFFKAASVAQKIKSTAKKVGLIGALGGAAYGAGKIVSESENPEHKQLRLLRKRNLLPYQQRYEDHGSH